MTDPIADLLARIRNAIIARKAKLSVPKSRVKKQIAEVLRDEGYLRSVEETDRELVIELRWGSDNRPAIEKLRRLSRPGQRMYARSDELGKVRSGLGISIVTTSKGIMTDRAARKAGLGGELICEVW